MRRNCEFTEVRNVAPDAWAVRFTRRRGGAERTATADQGVRLVQIRAAVVPPFNGSDPLKPCCLIHAEATRGAENGNRN